VDCGPAVGENAAANPNLKANFYLTLTLSINPNTNPNPLLVCRSGTVCILPPAINYKFSVTTPSLGVAKYMESALLQEISDTTFSTLS